MSAPPALSWRPLLEGQRADEAMTVVRAIADDIASYVGRSDPAGRRIVRDPFTVLLFAHLGSTLGEDRYTRVAEALYARAIATLPNLRSLGLYGGLAGMVWLDAYLDRFVEEGTNDGDADESDDEDRIELGDRLAEALDTAPGQLNCEIIQGLAGFGIAWLEQLPSEKARRHLESLVAHAEASAESTGDGVRWLVRPEWMPPYQREVQPAGHYNLGVSHGSPGLATVLARIAAAGIASERAHTLAAGAMQFVLQQRSPGVIADFPSAVAPTIKSPEQMRGLRWCYGGLGIGCVLLVMGRLLNRTEWVDEGLRMLRLLTERRDLETAAIRDAGLCHGAVGCAHLFNRAFQQTNDSGLADAARYWFDVTLRMRVPGTGIGGYRMWGIDLSRGSEPTMQPAVGWQDDASWLEGATGVALALLAAATPNEPVWDRLLGICPT